MHTPSAEYKPNAPHQRKQNETDRCGSCGVDLDAPSASGAEDGVCGLCIEETAVECDNCDWTGCETETAPIRNIFQRVAPGEPMPAGECPECGALCHHRRTQGGPYSAELAEAFRIGARELCNCSLGDRVDVPAGAKVEEAAGGGGVYVHCRLFVSDGDRAALANEE